jgi:hypothetical protein
MADYCRQQKVLRDELNALGTTIIEKYLVKDKLHDIVSQHAYMHMLALKKRMYSRSSTCPHFFF